MSDPSYSLLLSVGIDLPMQHKLKLNFHAVVLLGLRMFSPAKLSDILHVFFSACDFLLHWFNMFSHCIYLQ